MRRFLALIVCFSYCQIIFAQSPYEKCGFNLVKSSLVAKNPDFDKYLRSKIEEAQNLRSTAKTTGGLNVTVPIIFHIVLNDSQISLIGGTAGIAQRVSSEMEVLNADFNRGNADSASIPEVFKPFYGNVNIKFGLAHTDPNGNATEGWEIIHTTHSGFDMTSLDSVGNALAGRNAKHSNTGGADAWDVKSYVNIWVINMLNGTIQSSYIGFTVPPAFTDSAFVVYGTYEKNSDPYPKAETGLLIRFDAFGKRATPADYYYSGIDLGRTCTHEMGHYFGLFHPWGDDGGLCPWNGGQDDGIKDTPPECNYNFGCPAFPKFDCCDTASPGIMFMNYMDYSDDACLNMFTIDQISVMDMIASPAGESAGLSSHPQLLSYPGNVQPTTDNNYYILNPAVNQKTAVNFNDLPDGFESITLLNSVGQKVMYMSTAGQQTTYFPVDLSNLAKGVYLLRLQFKTGIETRKIVNP